MNTVAEDFGDWSVGRMIKWVAIIVGALIALMWLWPLTSVPTGSRGVVTIGGAITNIEDEGYAMLWPWEHLSLFSIRAEQADIKSAEGGTNDQQPVWTSLTVRYSITPNKVAEVFEKYSHTGDLSNYVQTATAEAFKAVTARYSAPDLILKRGQVSKEIADALQGKLTKYGASVINIDMTGFSFSDSYMKAINEKATQEQLRQAAENEALTVRAQQQQKVIMAQAAADSQKASADGEAYAIQKLANANAEALRIQNAALAQNKDVLELRRIEVQKVQAERWNGQLPSTIYGSGGPIPFLNVTR